MNEQDTAMWAADPLDPAMRASMGARLRAGREAAGLEPEQVAQQLRLSTSFVLGVEAGDGPLMAWVYERKHLESLAAIVGVDLGWPAEEGTWAGRTR